MEHTCDWWFPNDLIQDNKIHFTNYYNKKIIMCDFDNDGDFDLEDIIEADIKHALFEEDDKLTNQYYKKLQRNQKQTKFLR